MAQFEELPESQQKSDLSLIVKNSIVTTI